MYNIAQDIVLLKNKSREQIRALSELEKHYYTDDNKDVDFFKDRIQDISMHRTASLMEAFLTIKEVCDHLHSFLKNEKKIIQKYSTAYHNILVGTYFYGNCDFLESPATTGLETKKEQKNTDASTLSPSKIT